MLMSMLRRVILRACFEGIFDLCSGISCYRGLARLEEEKGKRRRHFNSVCGWNARGCISTGKGPRLDFDSHVFRPILQDGGCRCALALQNRGTITLEKGFKEAGISGNRIGLTTKTAIASRIDVVPFELSPLNMSFAYETLTCPHRGKKCKPGAPLYSETCLSVVSFNSILSPS